LVGESSGKLNGNRQTKQQNTLKKRFCSEREEAYMSSSSNTTINITSTSISTTNANAPLQDLIQLFNELSSSTAFIHHDASNSLRRSLSLAIYFLQRNDIESFHRAREAFLKSGEIIREMSSSASIKQSNSTTISIDKQQQLQKDLRRLFEKIIVLIEYIDQRMSSIHHQQQQQQQQKQSNDGNAKKVSNWNRIAKKQINRLQQNEQHQLQQAQQQQQQQNRNQQSPVHNELPQQTSSSKSKLQKLIDLVKSGDWKLNTHSGNTTSSRPTPNSTIQHAKDVHKEDPTVAFQQLQQRLALVMSNQPLPATGSISGPETINSARLKTISLVELRQELSSIQGKSVNALSSLLTLYQQFSLYEKDNISDQLERYARASDGITSIFKRLDAQIYSHVSRVVFELECINQHRVIVNEQPDTIVYTPEEILIKYARSLNIDSTLQRLLHAKVLAEKFEHTIFHLTKSKEILEELLNLAVSGDYTHELKQGLDSLASLFIGQYRMRIVELNFCFGAITFSTSTNDYSEDRAIESLELMIKCLEITLQIKKMTSASGTELLHELLNMWLQSAVSKIYLINSEDIRIRLQDRSELKGLFFEATKLMYLCEFVMAEVNGLIHRFGKVFNTYLEQHSHSFLDIICTEFRSCLAEDVDRFCTVSDQHQMSKIKELKRQNNAGRIDFELSLGMFHRLVPLVDKTFKLLSSRSPRVKPFPVCDRFYAIVQRCIVYHLAFRLQAFAARAIENDKMVQPFSPSVLYTKSCFEIVNTCFDSLQVIADLDTVLLGQSKKYKSLLVDYIEMIHKKVLSGYMSTMSNNFQTILLGKGLEEDQTIYKTMNDRIKIACLHFNNVNGVFMLSKNILTKFNNTTFIQMPSALSHQDNEDSMDVDVEEQALTALDDGPADIFDLGAVKDFMSDIQVAANSIALLYAQFVC
jgi:hypothetical protein